MLAALTGNGEERPSIIFLDLNMPGMSGWECIAILKESEANKDIPVVMYSTSKHAEEISRAKAAGAIVSLISRMILRC